MSKAVEQRNNQDGFVKPGELVDIRGAASLTLQDRRVFNLLIEHAWPEIGDKIHKIPLSMLRGSHKGSERVADSVKTLMTTIVGVPTKDDYGRPAIKQTQLLGPTTRTIDEDSPNAMLAYRFMPELVEIIQDSRYWGRIKLFVMMSFTSKYALALYEALCLRGNLRINEQVFSVEEFRELLGVESKKYKGFPQLRQRVIDPAVTEINGLSDFNVTVEAIREGGQMRGTITGFRLWWEKKEREEWMAALTESRRCKVGRRARLAGTVESVAA